MTYDESIINYHPQIRIYVHGPGMKELADSFDVIRPIILTSPAWHEKQLEIVSIDKRSKVSTSAEPCVSKQDFPAYDPTLVSA